MMTMAMSEGFSGVTEAVEDDDDDDGETTAHKIDKLRALKGQERAAEMAKYFENGRFSLLKFLSVNRKELKPAFILGRRILSDPAGQSVSESTFSIHAAFASDLRRKLGAHVTSMMIKLNRNHARYFKRILPKIWARYCEKFGRGGDDDDDGGGGGGGASSGGGSSAGGH